MKTDEVKIELELDGTVSLTGKADCVIIGNLVEFFEAMRDDFHTEPTPEQVSLVQHYLTAF